MDETSTFAMINKVAISFLLAVLVLPTRSLADEKIGCCRRETMCTKTEIYNRDAQCITACKLESP